MPRVSDLTRILHSIDEGDSNAAEKLLPLVYDERFTSLPDAVALLVA